MAKCKKCGCCYNPRKDKKMFDCFSEGEYEYKEDFCFDCLIAECYPEVIEEMRNNPEFEVELPNEKFDLDSWLKLLLNFETYDLLVDMKFHILQVTLLFIISLLVSRLIIK